MQFLYGGSLEITLTVPLNLKFGDSDGPNLCKVKKSRY